jgi:hypothetical protein
LSHGKFKSYTFLRENKNICEFDIADITILS